MLTITVQHQFHTHDLQIRGYPREPRLQPQTVQKGCWWWGGGIGVLSRVMRIGDPLKKQIRFVWVDTTLFY